jgi:hypothetical protein
VMKMQVGSLLMQVDVSHHRLGNPLLPVGGYVQAGEDLTTCVWKGRYIMFTFLVMK